MSMAVLHDAWTHRPHDPNRRRHQHTLSCRVAAQYFAYYIDHLPLEVRVLPDGASQRADSEDQFQSLLQIEGAYERAERVDRH